MYYLENVYYWASEGCPDAVPAGIIAVNLGQNEANHNDEEIDDIRSCICSYGIFDDKGWQLDFQNEDIDLIRKDLEGSTIGYLTSGQIVADWQWEMIKKQPGLRFSEHNLPETIKFMEESWEEDFGT